MTSGGAFSFRRFTVSQEGVAMRLSTDSVLLGAWAPLIPGRMLDIGTGCGIVALMLAQRTEREACPVDGVEIDPATLRCASANFLSSPWSGRMRAVGMDVRDMARMSQNAGAYTTIVSNPPFHSETLLSPDARRASGRSSDALPFADLLSSAVTMLAAGGCLSLIVPASVRLTLVRLAVSMGLSLESELSVRTRSDAPPRRSLLCFRRGTGAYAGVRTLSVMSKGEYTAEYRELTKDFYLFF